MNAKIRNFTALVAVVLTFCLFVMAQSASAQSPNSNSMPQVRAMSMRGAAQSAPAPSPNRNCKQAKGNWFDTIDLNTGGTTGIITNGGILNGTTETVYNPAFVFTPDPNVVSYIAETTITTNQGQLQTSNVYIYNFVTGLWTAMGRINPDASTGRFVGATGVLYFNGKTIGDLPLQSYPSEITGEICFAN
ncbi:MAG: hypothetical protein H0U60_04675 [Blastocatellia bacterium]|nr:hypothetical protein [Blastocatellia bacterium]